ncbi:RDD family protein [Helicobacter sp. 13S00477-4]|nr:RDD family protein [Helicobacter sp. 13S00477-4]
MPNKKPSLLQISSEIYAFERIKALITDIFMIYTPILYITTYLILGSANEFRHSQTSIFICLCLYGIISSIFICISSQTPGLRYMNLVLIRTQGDKISFLRALIRFFIWVLGISLLIGIITPFFRKDKKFLHDILCDTIIIKKPKPINMP